ncbi:hypothetical protein FD754_000593 [Muntiacus muntjak]|uniref:Small ribosomal subunit protein eS10 n=1 Tax=Muntiacus muntjak TaxID=9888 RepID=A0A5N3W5B0_MUNMU|nr:hypothetical protein FD754_000593 [Muntiacus muntjak]
MVTKTDIHMPKHPELADKNVPNPHVMKAMQHCYWYFTNEHIQYLRNYLHLPAEITPATPRHSCPETGRPRPNKRHLQSAMPPHANKKPKAGAGSATEFQFRGGSGCGRGQPPQ